MKRLKIFLYVFGIFSILICLGSCRGHNEHIYLIKATEDKYLKQAASCTSSAVYYYSCECGEAGTSTFIYGAPLGHSFTDYVSFGNAGCLTDGTETAKCDRCDAYDTRVDEGSALGHSFTNYVSNKDATCSADGTKTAQCDRCSEKDTKADAGSMLPHTYSETLSKNETHHWYDATCGHNLKKDEEKHTYVDKICTLCQYPKPEALIEGIGDAEINGTQISILTKTDKLSQILLNVSCSEGASFKTYLSSDCTDEPSQDFTLTNGYNTVYIKVTSKDAAESRVYTVKIYKSFTATITFKDGDKVLSTVTHDTGYLFSTDYLPENKTGYTFEGWLLDGQAFVSQIIYGDITLDAYYKGDEYKITFDANGGVLPSNEMTVSYGDSFVLPVPSKSGYTFIGWQDANGKVYTDGVWNIPANVTLTAKWEPETPGIQLPSIKI